MGPVVDAIKPWHDLFILLGTASATLIGLLFVAASVASGVFTVDKHHALRAFLSPSVVHFSGVLVASLIALAPAESWPLLGALIAADAVFGLVYCGLVWRNMVQHGLSTAIDLEDRLYYAVFPAAGYALVLAAGTALAWQGWIGCSLLAFGAGLLLLVGIRNAWDMTTWVIMRRPE